jgi:hypothetical protein
MWLTPHQPSDPPQVIYKDASGATPASFELDREFESPDTNTVSKFRPFVYRDPRGEDENFFVHRARVIQGNESLYQYIADPDHAEGLQIWIWDRR